MQMISNSIKLVVVILLIVSMYSCKGQDLINQETEINTSKQVGTNILEIFEDSHGILWFGTSDSGVARYDGRELTYLSEKDGLCGETVANIAEERNGQMWFGTYSNMCLYNLNTLGNTSENLFSVFESGDTIPKLGYGWKNVITDKSGNIWVNTHHGIFQYVNNDFKEFKVPLKVTDKPSYCSTPGLASLELIDRLGRKWFKTDGEGAFVFDKKLIDDENGGFKQLTMEDGLLSNNIMSIAEDTNGNIWFACSVPTFDDRKIGVGGACRYDGKSITTFKATKGLYDANINTLYADLSGNVWIGATGVGLYRFEPRSVKEQEGTFTLYKENEQINLHQTFYVSGLQSMLEDSKGRLWLGYSGGLFRLEEETMINVTQNGPW